MTITIVYPQITHTALIFIFFYSPNTECCYDCQRWELWVKKPNDDIFLFISLQDRWVYKYVSSLAQLDVILD